VFRYALIRHWIEDSYVPDGDCILHKDFHPDGPAVGFLDGHPISAAVVDEVGCRYSFAGVLPRRSDGSYDVSSLRKGEWVVDPGLVYS